MDTTNQKWLENIARFNEEKSNLTKDDALLIIHVKEGKSPFANALDYGYAIGLFFQDPDKPKQILARSLADEILKLAS